MFLTGEHYIVMLKMLVHLPRCVQYKRKGCFCPWYIHYLSTIRVEQKVYHLLNFRPLSFAQQLCAIVLHLTLASLQGGSTIPWTGLSSPSFKHMIAIEIYRDETGSLIYYKLITEWSNSKLSAYSKEKLP